jgi:ribosomal protein S15P/S13E
MMRAFNRSFVKSSAQVYRIANFSTIPETALRYTHLPNSANVYIPPEIAPIVSLATANSKQELQVKQREVTKKFQIHEHDVGSSQVQSETNYFDCTPILTLGLVAVLTEKIRSLAKHFSLHKKDKSGMRGLTVSYLHFLWRIKVVTY